MVLISEELPRLFLVSPLMHAGPGSGVLCASIASLMVRHASMLEFQASSSFLAMNTINFDSNLNKHGDSSKVGKQLKCISETAILHSIRIYAV